MNDEQQTSTEGTQSQQPSVGQNQPQYYAPSSSPQVPQATPAPSNYAGYDLTERTHAAPQPQDGVAIEWEASEYVHHDKGALWIVGLIVVAAVLVVGAALLQIWTFAILIIIMAVAMGVFAFRPPKVLHYRLDGSGLKIDDRFYSFADFRAFGILAEGAFYTIMLMPAKRFMPAVNVFFAEQDGEKIVDILGVRLPMEQLHFDFLDSLMRRLRF